MVDRMTCPRSIDIVISFFFTKMTEKITNLIINMEVYDKMRRLVLKWMQVDMLKMHQCVLLEQYCPDFLN